MQNDLSEVPTSQLYSEIGRRRVAARRKASGRPKVLLACRLCGVTLGTREMRRHVALCRREQKQ
jgi:hypothetical protein